MRLLVLGFLALLCLASPAAFAAAPDPATDDQKTLYALGLAMSQSLAGFTLSESELEFVKAGMKDGWDKAASQVYDLASVNELEQAWLDWLRAEAGKKPRALRTLRR